MEKPNKLVKIMAAIALPVIGAFSGCGVHYSDGGYADFDGNYYPPEHPRAKQEKKAAEERTNSLFQGLGTSIIMQEAYGNKN